MLSLGLIMIARNEAHNLSRSLAPVAQAFDQVVVVDTGSQDDTAKLAAQMGAQVFQFNWQDDFALARNFAIDQASTDWLFWLDADNSISLAAVQELRTLISAQPGVVWALERVSRTGELLWQKRAFSKHLQARFVGRVHEQLEHPVDWASITSQIIVEHWGYQNPAELKRKGAYYLSLLQKSIADNPQDY